jgi:hypothetical protein
MLDKSKDENRLYVRLKPVGLISKTGTLVLDPKAPAVSCRVIDISRGGACLELAQPMKLPKRFVFVHGGTRKHCHLVWQKNERFGVGF